MIAIDTNVLIRFLVRDNEEQSRKVKELFKQQEKEGNNIFISNIVLVEIIWVLQSGYEVPKSKVISTVKKILSNTFSALYNFTIRLQTNSRFHNCFYLLIFLYLTMLNGEKILKILKERKPYLSKQFHVKEIGIFGSFSNDKNSIDSDIDFLVEFDTKKIDNYYKNKYKLKKYLEDIFNRDVDICRKKYIKPFVKDHIINTTIYA